MPAFPVAKISSAFRVADSASLDVSITDIPAGTYKLIVAGGGADQAGLPVAVPITMSLRHDVAPWGNFWLAVLAILVYPGYVFYRRLNYERERWD